ncbi:MAG: MDR family MFS transporter [Candidatus Methanomethylophilaceae archaeon]
MLGLGLAMLAACFDGTIVGTCGTVIALDLNGVSLYSWMITAYMLCETIMIPIAGKLSDLYGRKPLFLIGLGLFTVGSLMAGMSNSMEMLIVSRALQGLGGGILIPVATAAVADLYAPKDRARIQGLLGAVFGIGSGIGPLLGGYITEYISWHWCFYINLPLAVVSFILTIKKFPTPVRDEKPSIDVAGISLLTLLLLDFIMLFEFGGSKFEWVSVESVVMALAAVVLLVLFVTVERKAKEPVLSPKLIRNKTVVKACLFMFIFGIGMMGGMIYSNMFAISVLGLTTLKAGEYSLAMIAGMLITSVTSGSLVNRTGYRFWMVIGPIITFISMVMMSQMTIGTEVSYYIICQFVMGIGLGCMTSVVNTAVQNSSAPKEMGMTTSAVNLLRSIGTTVGTAIFSMLINSKLSSELYDLVPEIYDLIPHDTGVLEAITQFPMYAHDILLAFANSVDFAFLAGGVIILLSAIIGLVFKAKAPGKDGADVMTEE